jgi:thiol-disulfide isomerase/thioredoxin
MDTNRFAGLLAVAVFAVSWGCTEPGTQSSSARAAAPEDDAAVEPPKQAGVGVSLRIEDGKVLVSSVLPDGPAALSKAINKDDEIVAVADGDQEPVDVVGTKEVARVVGMIRGPIGRVVRLTVVPAGKNAADAVVVSMVRGDIKEIDTFVDGSLLPLGSKAPNFKFVNLSDAYEDELSERAGRVLVVEFWASWCGPCVRALDELNALLEEHPEWARRVEVLAVNVDEKKEDALALFNSKHWPHIHAVWAGPEVLKKYHVAALPTVFVLDRRRNVVAVDHRLDVAAEIRSLLPKAKGKAGDR